MMPETFQIFVGLSAEEFSQLDLVGRPFLSEQGNTVTRGIVSGFRYDAENWYLDLEQVDYLDKKTRQWNRRRETDEYTSANEMFHIYYSDEARTNELHLQIGGYGMSLFLGPKSKSPWTTVDWGDLLHTDAFEGGVLGESKLP